MGTYLGSEAIKATGSQIATAYLSQSIGAVIAPFIVGLIADRFFNAERILAVLHFGGAIMLWLCAMAPDYNAFLPYIMIYMILYMPTLALVNSICLRQMTNPNAQFPIIRVLGSIGWIVAGLIIGWLGWEQKILPLSLHSLHSLLKWLQVHLPYWVCTVLLYPKHHLQKKV